MDIIIATATTVGGKNLMMKLISFNSMMESAYNELAPHKICAYIYELANAFNGFYRKTEGGR